MLYWAAVFFVVSVVAGIFGFTKISAGAAGIAKVFFGLFVLLFIGALILGLLVLT
jgi:uncharacterized membrane protein YtjA (UPF0391 family)